MDSWLWQMHLNYHHIPELVPSVNNQSLYIYKLCSHVASHAASDGHIYSASVVDRDTTFCFLDPHVITPLAEVNA